MPRHPGERVLAKKISRATESWEVVFAAVGKIWRDAEPGKLGLGRGAVLLVGVTLFLLSALVGGVRHTLGGVPVSRVVFGACGAAGLRQDGAGRVVQPRR